MLTISPNDRELTDTSHLGPYLQLPHLLSLTWLAYPIISIMFVIFRLQLSIDSAQDAVLNAKQDLIASCKAAERAATSTASMPRYLAIASNQQINDAVNGTINAARATMVLALTIMEAIINFVIDIYRSTFLCFLELIVRSALSAVLGAVNSINSVLSSAFNAAVPVLIDTIKTVNGLIKAIPGIPQIPIPDLSSLQNVTLPSDFTNALQSLNDSLPSIADLKSKVEDLVDTPFEDLKNEINWSFGNLSVDVNLVQIPSQNTVTFCDQMDTSVVDDLGKDIVKVAKLGTALLVLLVVLLIGANCLLEWYKWRKLQDHLNRIREALRDRYMYEKVEGYHRYSNSELMWTETMIKHPLVVRIVDRLSGWVGMRPVTKDTVFWFFHYVFHPPALACFLIGFCGLICVEIQLAAIGPIEHRYQQQAAASVSDFSNLIATSVNASMYNDSIAYANAVNTKVGGVQSQINDNVFGWVNTTTTTLNNTVNAFYTDVQNVVNTVFGSTFLSEPMQEFVKCFIGSKIDAIENVLTFLHDNLHIDLPRVNDTVLVLSPATINEATQPIAQAAIGTGNGDESQGLVGRVVQVYVKTLKKERVMFALFIGLWFIVVFMAFGFILWSHYRQRKMRRLHSRKSADSYSTGFGSGFELKQKSAPLAGAAVATVSALRHLFSRVTALFARRRPAGPAPTGSHTLTPTFAPPLTVRRPAPLPPVAGRRPPPPIPNRT